MTIRTVRPVGASALLALVALSMATPSLAQIPLRVTMPGSAFAPHMSTAQMDDVPGGRRFRGKAFAKLTLRALVPMPAASVADPKVQKIVVHFRTNESGPSLRSVKLESYQFQTNLEGDYMSVERSTPDVAANAWVFKSTPVRVGGSSPVLLEVQFPGGFDSQVNPGEFVLGSVVLDFPRTTASFASPTLSNRPKAALVRP